MLIDEAAQHPILGIFSYSEFIQLKNQESVVKSGQQSPIFNGAWDMALVWMDSSLVWKMVWEEPAYRKPF